MIRARIRMFGTRMVVLLAMPSHAASVRSDRATVCLPHGSGCESLDSVVRQMTTSSARALRSARGPVSAPQFG
jgi:hypothetical protein